MRRPLLRGGMVVLAVTVLCEALRGEERPVSASDRQHWSFVAPRRPPLPRVKESGWARNPIDAFILDRLERRKLQPSPEADRATLLRRLSFDLTGLPPASEELDAFLADASPGAYERVVDRLLASPHYGERWAQHWLDLARYADSDGFEFDEARADAWRYRDWVVKALNQDLPYDQFVRYQLAGDEIAPDDPAAFIATGFNRCYPDMVDLNDQKLRRQNALNDITETTGLVFLGLTIGCARCHDHKFDPIRIGDFYRLQAFFTPARFRDDYPIAASAERRAYQEAALAWEREVTKLQAAVIHLEQPVRAVLAPELPAKLDDQTASAFSRPENERTRDDVHRIYRALADDRRLGPEVWKFVLDPVSVRLRDAWIARLAALVQSGRPILPQARGVDETTSAAPPTHVLNRGEFASPGAEVEPRFPVVLCRDEAAAVPRIAPSRHSTGRRQALADWLVARGQPLSARVMVNRLWQHHFGQGLVATPSDFGTMGSPPSHPELLDWLATDLVARGWSLKGMQRLILTSATYRQASRPTATGLAADPENSLYLRQNRKRLDGESIRDTLLAVSGQLNLAMGGPCVFPELPAELAKMSNNKGAAWPVSKELRDRNRRSLYVFVRRNLRYPLFEAFDRPDSNTSCPRRAVTTIAPQALSLLNSAIAHDAAAALASRVQRAARPDVKQRVEHAYRIVFGRMPDAQELRLAERFLSRDESLVPYCRALLNANEFIYID
jgi:Protein of unknown function (DUF1553)/Protein of unknown function (DUF1549)